MSTELEKEEAIKRFKENQTLSNLQELNNLGVELKVLKKNEWVRLTQYELPLPRIITLYNDKFLIDAIGVY